MRNSKELRKWYTSIKFFKESFIMKKVLVLLLALALIFGTTSALADDGVTITLFHNKVEITSQLEAFAAEYSATHEGVTVKTEALGGGADYPSALKAKLQADQMPEIFIIDGLGDYQIWEDYCSDLSDQSWVADTDLGFTLDGKVYGFPVCIEGFGLGYNADILAKAEIDPATLTTFSAVKAAFEKLDGMKEELGLDAVVAMGASVAGGMTWVTGKHNFTIYLGSNLDVSDTSIIDLFNEGKVDDARLAQYAKYVNLLFDYADQDALINGNYDHQLSSFASEKTAFLHQGNWVDPNMKQQEATFNMGFISHCFSEEETTGLFLYAPSFYCVNSQAPVENQEAAKAFLTYMATTEEGAKYMVEKAGMVSAFNSVTLKPAGQFSVVLMEANARGGNYAVRYPEMPEGFGMNTLGPIFELLAQDAISEADFCSLVADAIADAAAK